MTAVADTKVRPHGTRAKYAVEKCHCLRCSAANTNYETNRAKQKVYGRWQPYVDATPVREHVEQLRAAGLGYKRVAALAGVTASTVSKLLYGTPGREPSKQVRAETAEKLLAVTATVENLAPGTCVDATGVRRRLQALVANGRSQASLAARLGMTPGNFTTFMKSPVVTADKALAVRRLYEEWWDQPPLEESPRQQAAASRAHKYASEHGWLPPMAWDEDTIDSVVPEEADPADGDDIDPVVVARCLAGKRPDRITKGERQLVAREVLARGGGVHELSELLRCSGSTAAELLAVAG